MREHRLKTWPEYFEAHRTGRKNFEVRKNDRDFQVGDVLLLEEYRPGPCGEPTCDRNGYHGDGEYTGRILPRQVTYVMPGGKFGLAPGWCVLAVRFPLIGWARESYDEVAA